MALVVLGCMGLAQPIERPSIKPILLVPLYVYPHSWGANEYQRLIGIQVQHPNLKIIVILNVDFDGTDWKNDREYRLNMIKIAREMSGVNIKVIGYASSSYTRRPFDGSPKGSSFSSNFKTNVDRWLTYFPTLSGIFVDEMCYNLTLYTRMKDPCLAMAQSKAPVVREGKQRYKSVMQYYRQLYQYIRQTKGLEMAIANPGQTVPAKFFDGTVADAIVVYEGSEAYFDPTVYPLGSSPDRAGVLFYNDPAPFAIDKLKALLGRVGLFYTTDTMFIGQVLNPWGVLPQYIEDLANYLDNPQP